MIVEWAWIKNEAVMVTVEKVLLNEFYMEVKWCLADKLVVWTRHEAEVSGICFSAGAFGRKKP